MEEKILKIIRKHCQLSSKTVTKRASIELADHFEKFITWLYLSAASEGFEAETFEMKPVWYRQDTDKDYSFNEIFTYWKDNKGTI